MAFLKPLRAKIKVATRSADLLKMKDHLQSWKVKPPEERKRMQKYIGGVRKEVIRLQDRLDMKGEATKVTVYGLPINGGKDNPDRQHSWMVAQGDWEQTGEVPLELTATNRDVYDDDDDDYDEDDADRKIVSLWIFDGCAYLSLDPDLTPDDVRAVLSQEANKRRLALDKAHALQAMTDRLDKPRQRERITQEVRFEVWQRDGGRCVECGDQRNLEFDHIIPFAMGGSNTARNLQLLCGDCNRRKGMTLG